MKALRTKETTYCRVSQTERDSMRGFLESILEMGEEGLWNKEDEKINRIVFPAVFYTSGWTGYLPYMKLRRTLYKDGNQLSRNILYLYVLAYPWRSVPQYTVLTSESESNGQSLPVAVNARGQKYVCQLFTSVYIA